MAARRYSKATMSSSTGTSTSNRSRRTAKRDLERHGDVLGAARGLATPGSFQESLRRRPFLGRRSGIPVVDFQSEREPVRGPRQRVRDGIRLVRGVAGRGTNHPTPDTVHREPRVIKRQREPLGQNGEDIATARPLLLGRTQVADKGVYRCSPSEVHRQVVRPLHPTRMPARDLGPQAG